MKMMSEKNETVNVQVRIAERNYPLKVLKSDEEKVQKAVSLVNEKLKEYQTTFAGKDKQDYMAMCLLNLAVEKMNLHHIHEQQNRLLEEKMNSIEDLFSSFAS
jgi:cell division protein ZapA